MVGRREYDMAREDLDAVIAAAQLSPWTPKTQSTAGVVHKILGRPTLAERRIIERAREQDA